MIYISGILTGSTYLKVTDNATQETLTLPIKVVDYYEDLNLIHGSSSLRPNGDENLLPGVDDIFLVSNAARDAYFFKQGQRTAFSSGLELITKGTYALKQEDENKATLTLTFSLDASPATEHHFTVWGNTYPVSYTHLDVYKRQFLAHCISHFFPMIALINLKLLSSSSATKIRGLNSFVCPPSISFLYYF